MGDLWNRDPDRGAVAELPLAAQWARKPRADRRLHTAI
jgi:hypothetical protein